MAREEINLVVNGTMAFGMFVLGMYYFKTDKLLTKFCFALSALTLVNGLLTYFFNIPNVSMIFLVLLFIVFPMRATYIFLNKKTNS